MPEMLTPSLQDVLPDTPPTEAAAYQAWMRVVAISSSLALAGCTVAAKPEVNSTNMPTNTGAQYVRNPNRPAGTPNIELGVIVANIDGATNSQGFNELNTASLVNDAQSKITEATGGQVAFARSRYYGKVTLKLPHGANRCNAGPDGTSDLEFRRELTAAATKAAEVEGFEPNKTGGAGLIVFADYTCDKRIRSSAESADFSPQNDILIVEDLPSLQNSKSRTLPHEIGHVLGLEHASAKAKECPVGEPDDTCGDAEYGSQRSIMGNDQVWPNAAAKLDASIRFNGYELFALGALDESQRLEIDQVGVYDVTLNALHPGEGGTQLIRIPRMLDSFLPGKSHYWIELSTGGRDNNDPAGCEYTPADVKNCDQPYRLSVALETAGSGDNPKYISRSYLQPLSPLYDAANYMALGGVMAPPNDNEHIIYRDEKSGLIIQLLDLQDNRDRTGSANLRITLAGMQ